MLDSDICAGLAARLNGKAVAVCGGGELLAALKAEGGLDFCDDLAKGGAVIFAAGYGGANAEGDAGDGERAAAGDINYAEAAAGRPYIIVAPNAEELKNTYGCECLRPQTWDRSALNALLRALSGEFAVRTVGVDIPEWMGFLPAESSAISELISRVRERCANIKKFKDISALDGLCVGAEYWSPAIEVEYDFATGSAKIKCAAQDGIFFSMLSEIAGDKIEGEYSLMRYVRSAAEAKNSFEKVRDALNCACVNGYGIVSPSEDDLIYEQPEVVKQGNSVGIRLRASAPSYHIIRVDVAGEVSPIMGEGEQSRSLVAGMMKGFETDPEATWNTDVFGRSLKSMVKEGLAAKVNSIQDDTKNKLKKAITRMTNEGKGGVICIIL